MKFEILATLNALKKLCKQRGVKLRIECDNLETVYVETVDRERVLVHDHYHALHYLMTSGDTTYKTFDDIGLPAVRSLCAKHGVRLIDIDHDDTDPGWVIGDYADCDVRVQELILSIANCVDELFASSYRKK